MASEDFQTSLAGFAAFARGLQGDEKSEAQGFLERLFRALGHEGVIEAGATFEFRVAKKPGTAQLELLKDDAARASTGKKFADLLWPGRVLIEMKSRGVKLEKSYDQAFEYWQLIVPNRPRYVILCNFDEFWIYDFNQQLFDPVERLFLRDIAESINSLTFLLPAPREPKFGNNRVEVTRDAAKVFAEVFRNMIARGEDRGRAQRFILQLLVAVVAEDIGLLKDDIVTALLADCVARPAESYDLLGGLFRQMATKEKARGGRYESVDYFNGGLFAIVDPIALKLNEANQLHESALRHKWDMVKPEIFGTLFQQSMDAGTVPGTRDERHAFGAHFTSEFDIQKVVGPTIERPWQERIKACGNDKALLRAALDDLRKFRVLDPACGSGNFLFVAYRVMKRLERDLLARLKRAGAGGTFTSEVPLSNFFGLDVLPFAAELAKVTLMLAKELEIREAHAFGQSEDLFIEEKALPLENLDANILCADALFTDWPKADAIIGNPPYLGAKALKLEHGDDYVKKLRAAYPGVPGLADFCVYWYRKAHDHLSLGGRAGLVGTQNIRNNNSREGSLDYVVKNGGTITEAVSAQVWSGDAQVHVSIVNWLKGEALGEKSLKFQLGDSVDSPWETFALSSINSTLSVELDVTNAAILCSNQLPQRVFRGQEPGSRGFVLTPEERDNIVFRDRNSAEVIFPHLVGRDLVTGDGAPMRWIIDFGVRDQFAAAAYQAAFEHVKDTVLQKMQSIVSRGGERGQGKSFNDQFETARLNKWWLFRRSCNDTIQATNCLSRYVACSRHGKRPIFEFISPKIHPDSAIQVFAFEDDYSFGILQSGIHWIWFRAKCSKLKGDFRYTPESVFDTFPWPQSPTRPQIAEVAAAAVALRTLRREVMTTHGWSLRDLYRTLDEPGDNPLRTAQARLDTAVRAAYAMPAKADSLAFLLALNLDLAAKEQAGETITPPGLPLPEAERAAFISADCVSVKAS